VKSDRSALSKSVAPPRLNLVRWKRDPVSFIREVLVNPESGEPFELYQQQIVFLRTALTIKPDGRLAYPELVFAAPKKSGKTALAAFVAIYFAVAIGGPAQR
jgi:hypothetical protein